MNLWETFEKLNKIYGAKERLEEGKKIVVPDHNQQPKIDSYIIEMTLRWANSKRYYLKKDWFNGKDWWDFFTEKLEEAERFNSLKSAREEVIEVVYRDTTKYKWKDKQHLIASCKFDLDELTNEDEDWDWIDYRIKALYAHKTVYLELED